MDGFRVVSGWIFLIFGIVLTLVGMVFLPVIIYGIIGIIIGTLLLMDIGREDKIEKIKRRRK